MYLVRDADRITGGGPLNWVKRGVKWSQGSVQKPCDDHGEGGGGDHGDQGRYKPSAKKVITGEGGGSEKCPVSITEFLDARQITKNNVKMAYLGYIKQIYSTKSRLDLKVVLN